VKNLFLRTLLVLLLFIPAVYGLVGEKYNKATKRDELILVSTQQEKKIGAAIAKQVAKKFKDADDPLLQKRIAQIGEKIAEVSDREDVIYRFKVLKAKNPDNYNAFALPGGYIYIFDTLVKKTRNDDEVAAILAHELAHIAAKHSIKKLQTAMGLNALVILGITMRTDPRTFSKAMDALNHLMVAYSREAEVEADVLSVRYMKEAGFNPEAVISVLELMHNLRKKGPLMRYLYYRSHPYMSERLARIKTEVHGKTDFDSFINLPERGADF